MKAQDLFEAINDIDETIIEEAEITEFKFSRKKYLKIIIPIAACILVVLIGVFQEKPMNMINSNVQDATSDELPMIANNNVIYDGNGFEGCMAYNIEEIKNDNPWTEEVEIKELSVFENPYPYNEGRLMAASDEKLREETAKSIAKLLKADIIELYNEPTKAQIEATKMKMQAIGEQLNNQFYIDNASTIADCGEIKITVSGNMDILINFKNGVKLPEKYNFSYYSSYEELQMTAEYLKKIYIELLQMKEPKINIYGGDYTFDGERSFNFNIYEGYGNIEDRILAYNFNNVGFYCNDEGKLFGIRINKMNLSKKIGDYPIITSKEAKESLTEGKYITSVPKAFPGEEYIRRTELVYKGIRSETLMPYYKFYVEIPEMKLENGLNTYGIFYVPAVEEKYLK